MRVLALAAAWVLSIGSAFAAHESTAIGGILVDVWMADDSVISPRPVVVFSHGFHGCATQSRYLMEAFADSGYLVVAPHHRDATCRGGGARWFKQLNAAFRQASSWNEESFRDRADDIVLLIEGLRTDERFRADADLSRLALAGHSLGGYTALGLAGAWPGWKLPEVKAVLALSPYSQPFLTRGTLSALATPVMYQGGTLDIGNTPPIGGTAGSYEQSSEPKYFVEFEWAGHFAWTNLGVGHRDAIVAYSLAFLNRYVRGDAPDGTLTRALSGVSNFHYASELGRGDF